MKIQNTKTETTFPWPEDVYIQGGERGVVIRPDGSYRTAFVEVSPPGTFLRGEGETIAEAEAVAWEKYQRFLYCTDGGSHGPFEPRHYTNGAGFCTKCGGWFSRVCEPSQEYKANEAAVSVVLKHYGEKIIASPFWNQLTTYWTACVLAAWNKTEYPSREGLPTEEEIAAWLAIPEPTEEEMVQALAAVLERLGDSD